MPVDKIVMDTTAGKKNRMPKEISKILAILRYSENNKSYQMGVALHFAIRIAWVTYLNAWITNRASTEELFRDSFAEVLFKYSDVMSKIELFVQDNSQDQTEKFRLRKYAEIAEQQLFLFTILHKFGIEALTAEMDSIIEDNKKSENEQS